MTGSKHSRHGALEVVAPDEFGVVVFKPAGLSSERPSRGSDFEADCLLLRAKAQFGWPDARLPHRLDRPTRGLVVISRDAKGAAAHAAEIREGAWTKWYVARIPSTASAGPRVSARDLVGQHRAYLRRAGTRAEVVRSGGDPSRLTILAVAPAGDRSDESHALILLETGRFHQIRVMLASLGFPLVGDSMYGGRPRAARDRTPADLDAADLDAVDLEAIGLCIARGGQIRAHRIRSHVDRVGVAESIEVALDAAISDVQARR